MPSSSKLLILPMLLTENIQIHILNVSVENLSLLFQRKKSNSCQYVYTHSTKLLHLFIWLNSLVLSLQFFYLLFFLFPVYLKLNIGVTNGTVLYGVSEVTCSCLFFIFIFKFCPYHILLMLFFFVISVLSCHRIIVLDATLNSNCNGGEIYINKNKVQDNLFSKIQRQSENWKAICLDDFSVASNLTRFFPMRQRAY